MGGAGTGGAQTENSVEEEPEYLRDQLGAIEARRERESTRHDARMTQAQKTIIQMKSKQKTLTGLLLATGGVP